jgi:hypothetical protein
MIPFDGYYLSFLWRYKMSLVVAVREAFKGQKNFRIETKGRPIPVAVFRQPNGKEGSIVLNPARSTEVLRNLSRNAGLTP